MESVTVKQRKIKSSKLKKQIDKFIIKTFSLNSLESANSETLEFIKKLS